MSQRNCKDA